MLSAVLQAQERGRGRGGAGEGRRGGKGEGGVEGGGGGEIEGVEENKGVRKRIGCIVLCSQHPRTPSVLVACASATSSPSSC